MKGKIIGFALGIGLILLLASGFIGDILNFFLWLFILDNSAPETSFLAGIVVRVLTFLISFGLVGLFFNLLGYHEKILMSVSYYIISVLVGFGLSCVVRALEQYIFYIGIGLAALIAAIVITWLIVFFCKRHKEKQQELPKTA